MRTNVAASRSSTRQMAGHSAELWNAHRNVRTLPMLFTIFSGPGIARGAPFRRLPLLLNSLNMASL